MILRNGCTSLLWNCTSSRLSRIVVQVPLQFSTMPDSDGVLVPPRLNKGYLNPCGKWDILTDAGKDG
ncbi:hypothetical protein AAHA92_26950 [Salvia divinorum]|uniref:Uncharacterized protein n=1 Tax=Salvia divinorum TaxID=28513 RepID=A0ABD1G247_SALDI